MGDKYHIMIFNTVMLHIDIYLYKLSEINEQNQCGISQQNVSFATVIQIPISCQKMEKAVLNLQLQLYHTMQGDTCPTAIP